MYDSVIWVSITEIEREISDVYHFLDFGMSNSTTLSIQQNESQNDSSNGKKDDLL